MKNYDYIEIDKYLNGELSKDELLLFEEKLKNDNDFAIEVKLYKEIENSLTSKMSNQKEENDLRNTLEDLGLNFKSENKKLKIKSKKLSAESKKIETKVFSLKRYSKYLVAASLVLFATLLWQSNINPVYNDFAKHKNIDLVVRGNSDKHLINAQDAFNTKDYATAEKELRALLYLDRTKVELQLYLGICLVEQNEFKKAENILEKIMQGKSVFKNTATWYLALSKLKQKDYKSCKNYLIQIPKDAEEFLNAKKLLRKL